MGKFRSRSGVLKVGLKWEKEDQHQLLTISVISARCLFCIFCSWQLIIQRYKIWGLICEYVRNLPSVNQTDNFSDPYVKVRVQQSQNIEKVGISKHTIVCKAWSIWREKVRILLR